jgi:hypothetical protein
MCPPDDLRRILQVDNIAVKVAAPVTCISNATLTGRKVNVQKNNGRGAFGPAPVKMTGVRLT